MHDNEKPEYKGPSKSQKKRDMQSLQALGEELVQLSAERLRKLEIDESLREAVLDAHRMPQRTEAFRRQMQYIGRLMRDADTAPIRAALDAQKGQSRTETARMHRLEALRDRFLEDEGIASDIARQYPAADIQHLRQLRRNALRDREQNRPPRAYREIYRDLRELDDAARLGSPDSSEADDGERNE